MPTESEEPAFDHEVVIVGGGPAGCSAGVFTARAGLDTVVFDRGRSSIQRCAHIENYLGFPSGIDIGTFYDLMHDHVEEAGCTLVPDLVESVEHAADTAGFVVRPQSGEPVTARRVIAATRYDAGEYLRGLDDDDAMFVTREYEGRPESTSTRSTPRRTARRPSTACSSRPPRRDQRAGDRGRWPRRQGRRHRRRGSTPRPGYPDNVAAYYDWRRRERDRTGEWEDRDRWREFYEGRFPDDHDLSAERVAEIREREIDRRLDQYITDEAAERRARAGQRRLLRHIDDDLVLEAARELEGYR
ncbi:alkyl hydroperoxide reductase subunit F [Halolamina pelagica]|uniref:Alkyl hydroperoxide reductase subunit F n=1 Tax=Halolamina pelagica TaxID=699431 RepID=A0A0P7FVE6_9EURY|nr:NAD(P)/FAD-dependent oxidoreductase [Halolamina pelagica]KPN30882.1 alkyl hydroperoxide reductase subunit F [Halolamina pelagica]